jgi:hypothetical protein
MEMRRTRWTLAAAVAALLVASVATPALAARHESTGDRISLFAGDRTYPADAAFFVSHGNGAILGQDTAIGRGFGPEGFTLDVDGARRDATYWVTGVGDGAITTVWVFNFPGGMTGVHTFTGHWWAPCGAPTAEIACGDSPPTTPVEYLTEEIAVTFVVD